MSKVEEVYEYIKNNCFSRNEASLDEICRVRGYIQPTMREYFDSMDIYPLDINLEDLREEFHNPEYEEVGLFTSEGFCILKDRYVIPVYDALGNLVTLIGWLNDFKRYITLATPSFSKSLDFFNIDMALPLARQQGFIIVVEGIFDALSLSANGLPVVATMGSDVNNVKKSMLSLFNWVFVVTDNDKTGNKMELSWIIGSRSTLVKIKGVLHLDLEGDEKGLDVPIKDVDDLCKYYSSEDIQALFHKMNMTRNSVEFINLSSDVF